MLSKEESDAAMRALRDQMLKLREEGHKLDAEIEETLRKLDAIQKGEQPREKPPSTQS